MNNLTRALAIFHQRQRSYLRDQRGTSSIEYSLLLSMFSLAMIVSVTSVSSSAQMAFNSAANALIGPVEGNRFDGGGPSGSDDQHEDDTSGANELYNNGGGSTGTVDGDGRYLGSSSRSNSRRPNRD